MSEEYCKEGYEALKLNPPEEQVEQSPEDKAFQSGLEAGRKEGYQSGFEVGKREGYQEGYADGFDTGLYTSIDA